MFYLIVAILISSFYFFIAPKSVKNTMNLLFVMVTSALLLLLAVLSIIKFFSLPGEFFVTVGMLVLSYFTLKDFFSMSELNHEKTEQKENVSTESISKRGCVTSLFLHFLSIGLKFDRMKPVYFYVRGPYDQI